jgi:preprotein translocase subunit Sec61beta
MTSDTPPSTTNRLIRKVLIPGALGGVAGFAASAGMMRYIDSDAVGGLGPSATIAALVAVLYIVIALGVMLGTASPALGARFLNVEDADELREQKAVMLWSGGSMLLWGVALLALALGAPDGPLPQPVALVLGAGGLVIGSLLSVVVYRASDELMLAVNLEAGALSYGLVLLVVGLWAMLAHLGYAAGPQPLDLLTAFYVLVLLASFIVIGRRGMLRTR